MTKKLYSYELLEALCNTFGPSGCEDAVAELICEQIDDLGAEIKRDKLGNLICRFSPDTDATERKKLMISAHMDEVGFMVSEITEKGYLRFGEVGGIMSAVLSGRHVVVGDENSQVGGVIASKAIHQKSAEDRLSAVFGGKELSLNLPADAVKNMLLGAEVPLRSGAGYVKVVEALDRIALVNNGIYRSMYLFAIVDIDTLVVINGNLKVIICAYLRISNVPESVAKLGNRGKYCLSYCILNVFLHFFIPF